MPQLAVRAPIVTNKSSSAPQRAAKKQSEQLTDYAGFQPQLAREFISAERIPNAPGRPHNKQTQPATDDEQHGAEQRTGKKTKQPSINDWGWANAVRGEGAVDDGGATEDERDLESAFGRNRVVLDGD